MGLGDRLRMQLKEDEGRRVQYPLALDRQLNHLHLQVFQQSECDRVCPIHSQVTEMPE